MKGKGDDTAAKPDEIPAGEYNPFKMKAGGRTRAFVTEDDMRKLIAEYFELWEKQSRPLTVAGMCVFLEISKDTFSQYCRGTYDTELNKFSETCNMARLYIENQKLEKSLKGDYNATIAKFDLTNNHGYTEKSEIAGNVKKPLRTLTFPDAAAAERAYNEMLKEETGQ